MCAASRSGLCCAPGAGDNFLAVAAISVSSAFVAQGEAKDQGRFSGSDGLGDESRLQACLALAVEQVRNSV